ncbi:MAG: D-glycero-beta-D-manno-heptose 1-phosphate adenylyltransferase [Candidatus Omnitrophica bacterium]|nr:D-glycero-beta-D-manno-heptose 1-phosphate adenylyltransferase [Candidatus Omnitrophota bacterium]MDD5487341.1 D-glycero-beta-D-manno-heptose 1-phosphate adenylyltransferase [Candidatus Omnitrophota bacterium]
MYTDKIREKEELKREVISLKASGSKVGFTNGCFDILHRGHARYLAEAKGYCDRLIVAVNTDNSVKRIKGPDRPVNPCDARMEMLAALEAVDLVTSFGEDTPEDIIKYIVPDIIFKGGDWKENDIVGGEFVKKNGGMVRVIPYLEGFSTTRMIKDIKGER